MDMDSIDIWLGKATRTARLGRLYVVLILSLLPSIVSAGSMSGRVNRMLYMPGGAVLVYLDGPEVGRIACNSAGRFAINTNNATGKAQLAGVMSAQASQARIEVYGESNCGTWGDSESVQYIVVPR